MEQLKQRSDLFGFVNKIVKSNGINDYDIKKVETNQKGEGFLGDLFFITINDKVTRKEIDLVIKASIRDEQIRQSVPIRKIFENEIYGYSTLFPQYEKFLRSKGLKNDNKYDFIPKCYHTFVEEKSEVVILENLRTRGFESISRQSFFDGKHIEKVFETFGRLHGASYAYKDQHPEEYKQLASKLTSAMVDLMVTEIVNNEFKRLGGIIEEHIAPKLDHEIQEKLRKYGPSEINDTFIQTLRTNSTNSIILHGDCWSNNMLFKYNKSTGEPIDMRLIDLQLMHYGNPTCDLSYCLYAGSVKDVFNKLDDYLLIYHRSLTDTIRKLGSDPERLLSLECLKNDWKHYAKFGFILGSFAIQLKIKSDTTDLTDIDFKKDAHINCNFNMEEYCSKLMDIIVHLDKYGVL